MTSETFTPRPPFKELVAELILTTHIPGRHAARNALAHIAKAWEIKDIDPTMAAFRAIIGVEEAATAIFHVLKRQKYTNAHLLNKDHHFHKAAVYPYFQAIGSLLASLKIKVKVLCDTNKDPKKLELGVTLPFDPFKDTLFQPVPSLHFEIRMDDKIYNFSEQIAQLVSERNAKSFCKYSNELANFRNKLLYSSNQGIPSAQLTENKLKRKEGIIINFQRFCPEVVFDRFGLFASELYKYSDEIDIKIAQQWLLKERAAANDYRWNWSYISPLHYTECQIYSLIKGGQVKNVPNPIFPDIGVPDSITTNQNYVTEGESFKESDIEILIKYMYEHPTIKEFEFYSQKENPYLMKAIEDNRIHSDTIEANFFKDPEHDLSFIKINKNMPSGDWEKHLIETSPVYFKRIIALTGAQKKKMEQRWSDKLARHPVYISLSLLSVVCTIIAFVFPSARDVVLQYSDSGVHTIINLVSNNRPPSFPQNVGPKNIPIPPGLSFEYKNPTILREKTGRLLVELPVKNLRPTPITFIAPQYGDTMCAIWIVDTEGMRYSTNNDENCSMKTTYGIDMNAPQYMEKMAQKGQPLRPNEEGILTYSMFPIAQPANAVQTKSFRVELLVIQKDAHGRLSSRREELHFPAIKIE